MPAAGNGDVTAGLALRFRDRGRPRSRRRAPRAGPASGIAAGDAGSDPRLRGFLARSISTPRTTSTNRAAGSAGDPDFADPASRAGPGSRKEQP